MAEQTELARLISEHKKSQEPKTKAKAVKTIEVKKDVKS